MDKGQIFKLAKQQEEIEPETLQQLMPQLSSVERQQILALRILIHTRAAYEDFYVFENVCLAVNGIEPTIDAVEGCKPEHIWYTLEIARKLNGNRLPWLADEVISYIKFCFKDHGLTFLHPYLDPNKDRLYAIINLAHKGPFPLEETEKGIQASHYLRIQEYLKSKRPTGSYQ
jgi:hypothetical protein